MAKQRLLIVDSDVRSLRVLEVSLRKAGYNISVASDGADALGNVETDPPDLIISDIHMPNMDGYAFAKQVKTNPQWVSIPFIFLSRSPTVEEKIRGLELGVDDFLSKPIFVKEVIARVRVLLQRAARENLKAKDDAKTTFAGSLEDMTVVDVLQSIDFSRKSGALQLTRGNQTGYLYFRDGHIIDAQLGELRGEQAVYRVFTWSEGSFNFEFRSVRRNDVIGENTQALLLEGVRRLDEWGRLLEGLPPLTTKFDVDYEELAEQLADIPDELNHILRHFDGHATILDVVDRSGLEDLDALAAISQLYFDGLVYDPQSEDSTLRKVGRPPETGASPMPPRSATPPPRGTPSTVSEEAPAEEPLADEELAGLSRVDTKKGMVPATTASDLPPATSSPLDDYEPGAPLPSEPAAHAPPSPVPEEADGREPDDREADKAEADDGEPQQPPPTESTPPLVPDLKPESAEPLEERPDEPKVDSSEEEIDSVDQKAEEDAAAALGLRPEDDRAPPRPSTPAEPELHDAEPPPLKEAGAVTELVRDDSTIDQAEDLALRPLDDSTSQPTKDKVPLPEESDKAETVDGDAEGQVGREPTAQPSNADQTETTPRQDESTAGTAEPGTEAAGEPPPAAELDTKEQQAAKEEPQQQETQTSTAADQDVQESTDDEQASGDEQDDDHERDNGHEQEANDEQESDDSKLAAGDEQDGDEQDNDEQDDDEQDDETRPASRDAAEESHGEFFSKDIKSYNDHDSFADLSMVGEDRASRVPMILSLTLIAAAIAAGVGLALWRHFDQAAEFENLRRPAGEATAQAADDEDSQPEDHTSSGDTDEMESPPEQAAALAASPAGESAPSATDGVGPDGGRTTDQAPPSTAAEPEAEPAAVATAPTPEPTPTATQEAPSAPTPTPAPAEAGSEPTAQDRRQARRLGSRALAMAEGNPTGALQLALQATELDPSQAAPWYVIGYIEHTRDNNEGARAALERCLAGRGTVLADCRALQRSLR